MRLPWIVLMIGTCGFRGDPTPGQDEGPSKAPPTMEQRLQKAQRDLDEIRLEIRLPERFAGSPGAGSGGDLFSSVLELFRQPSGLWDFKPRSIPRSIPDRETAEFLRDRR